MSCTALLHVFFSHAIVIMLTSKMLSYPAESSEGALNRPKNAPLH